MIKLVVFAVAAICLAKSTTATYEVHFEYNEQEFTKLLLEFLPGDVSHHKVLEQAEKFKYDEALKVWNDTVRDFISGKKFQVILHFFGILIK